MSQAENIEAIFDPIHVAYDEVDPVWPAIQDRIEAAVLTSRGKIRAEDVYDALVAGEMQLHLVTERDEIIALLVTELKTFPTGLKVCSIVIATGERMREWWPMIVELEKWARSKGCLAMKNDARPGWGRILKDAGYETTHVVVEKDLTNG